MNQPVIEIDSARPIADFFRACARICPDRIALIYREQRISYRELDERSSQWAHRLRAASVGPEVVVAICARRSIETVIAMLAILKADGAYLPLDPAFPDARIEFMLQDSGAPIVLTQRSLSRRFRRDGVRVMVLDEDPVVTNAAAAPFTRRSGANLAYLMYTSGSTGTPKGVMIENRNVVNFFTAMDRIIGTEPGVWLAVTSISFDISVLELLWTLTRGYTVVLQGEEDRLFFAGDYSVSNQIRNHRVTHLQCTPTYAAMLMQLRDTRDAMKSLRKLFIGGEALPPALAKKLSASLHAEIYNLYGPTETTIWSTSHRLEGVYDSIPIGKPVANTSVFIFDEQMRPVVPGAVGELYIGGAGVARGYWKNPGLTAERFVPNPHPASSGERLYKTGDLGRFGAKGVIEFHGRADDQVKIRGFRIELGEVENALGRLAAVHQGAVAVRANRKGDRQLVAYVVLKPRRLADPSALLAQLRKTLPEYMIPGAVVLLDALPTTPNGKVDRKALPNPAAPYPANERDVPFSPIETKFPSSCADGLDFQEIAQAGTPGTQR